VLVNIEISDKSQSGNTHGNPPAATLSKATIEATKIRWSQSRIVTGVCQKRRKEP